MTKVVSDQVFTCLSEMSSWDAKSAISWVSLDLNLIWICISTSKTFYLLFGETFSCHFKFWVMLSICQSLCFLLQSHLCTVLMPSILYYFNFISIENAWLLNCEYCHVLAQACACIHIVSHMITIFFIIITGSLSCEWIYILGKWSQASKGWVLLL